LKMRSSKSGERVTYAKRGEPWSYGVDGLLEAAKKLKSWSGPSEILLVRLAHWRVEFSHALLVSAERENTWRWDLD